MPYDPLKIGYRKASELVLNVDAIDFATGLGLKTFYGAKVAGSAYILTTNPFYSDSYTHSTQIHHTTDVDAAAATGGVGTFATKITANFDITFKRSAELEGTAIVNVPYAGYNVTGAQESHIKITATLSKGATGVEDSIATGDSDTSVNMATQRFNSFMSAIPLTIGKTNIAKGETLRLKIEVKYASAGTACNLSLAHDPKNRQPPVDATEGTGSGWNTGDPSQLTIQLPFIVKE